MSRSTAQLPLQGQATMTGPDEQKDEQEKVRTAEGPNLGARDSKRLLQENWGSLMEFLGDGGERDCRNSVSSTHGTTVLQQPRGSHQSNVTVAVATATPGSGDERKNDEAESTRATMRPMDDAKLQSLVDFSKKVGLNHRVIQTVQLIEQSG